MTKEYFKMDKSRIIAFLLSIGIFIFLSAVYTQLTLFDGLENNSVDFKFYIKSPEQKSEKIKEGVNVVQKNPNARDDIIILGIDNNTLSTFNNMKINWPFPWNVHAKFAKYVGSGNPSAIFFDIMFLDHKEHENEFADAIKKAKCVFIDYQFEKVETNTNYLDIEERMAGLNKLRFPRDPDDTAPMWVEEAVPPVPKLLNAAMSVGFANVLEDSDHVFRRMPLVIKYSDKKESIVNDVIDIVNNKSGLSISRLDLQKDITSKLNLDEAKQTEIIKAIFDKYNISNEKGINLNNFPTLAKVSNYINNKMSYYYPGIDLLLVMRYFGIGTNDVEIKIGKYIKLKNLPVNLMKKPNEEREIEIPIDHQGFMDINFVGGFGSFNYYPYIYFYQDGVFNNPSLQNKILMVAAFASTGVATDIHKSPYGETYGIEHHANTLNTILNQDFITKFNTWQNILILLVLAVLLGFFLPRLSIVKSIILTICLILIYMIGSQVLFETKNILFIYFTAILQIGISFAFVIAYRVITEQKEKKQIRQTFSKLVDKSVVDELLKSPEELKLGGEKKVVTVLFSDIRGFTTITERMPSEALVKHLNDYLEAMTNIVKKYKGTLDKYVGDEIMAFWGAPIPQQDHAILACRAAVEMMAVLKGLNEMWVNMKPEPKPAFNIGVGLNTGDMHVALMGSSSRMDYTLIGDNVNLGARLEGTNKQYKTNIIISEFTYAYVKENVIARELDLVRVKGKEKPVKIYELIDMKSDFQSQ